MRVNELNISNTDHKNKREALKQIISHIEQAKEGVKLKIKQLKTKIKNIPKENPFDFTDYVEKQTEENEIDLGLFLELAEENKIIYNQTPVTTLIEDMEKLKNGFFTNGYFTLGEEGEIDTNRFFKDSNELAKFIDKILDKYDDHPSIYYTGNIYRYFKNFKRVKDLNTEEELMNFIIFQNMKVKTVISLVETDAFSNVLTISSTKNLAMNISNS